MTGRRGSVNLIELETEGFGDVHKIERTENDSAPELLTGEAQYFEFEHDLSIPNKGHPSWPMYV